LNPQEISHVYLTPLINDLFRLKEIRSFLKNALSKEILILFEQRRHVNVSVIINSYLIVIVSRPVIFELWRFVLLYS